KLSEYDRQALLWVSKEASLQREIQRASMTREDLLTRLTKSTSLLRDKNLIIEEYQSTIENLKNKLEMKNKTIKTLEQASEKSSLQDKQKLIELQYTIKEKDLEIKECKEQIEALQQQI